VSRLHLKVDQSSKIETSHDTILAYSNSRQYTMRLSSRVKREALARLRKRGRSKPRAVIYLFAAGLFLLLRDVLEQVSQVTIDLEYIGHEADIKSMLMRFARMNGLQFEADAITFAAIGKGSAAHELAISVFRGHRKADRAVTAAELLGVSQGKKKRPGGA